MDADADGPTGRRARAGTVLVWVALVALGVSLLPSLGLGFRYDVGGIRVSFNNPIRAQTVAVLFGAAGVWLLGRAGLRSRFARPLALADRALQHAPWLVGALALATAVFCARHAVLVVGGADSAGYMSQARLWQSGTLAVPLPLASRLKLEHGLHPLTPLGFKPSVSADAAVPSYPPGFPLSMAAASTIGGAGAEFVVAPLTTVGLVVVTFLLGVRIAGTPAGLMSAALMASLPTALFQGVQPMSDVPSAFCWTVSLLMATYRSHASAVAAGVAAAAAGLVRPNLFALTPVVALAIVWWEWWEGRSRSALVRAAAYAIPAGVAAVGFAAFQAFVYGAVTETGYGGITYLFSLDHVLPNLSRYPWWLLDSQSPLFVLAPAAPLVIARGWVTPQMEPDRARRMAWSGLALGAALLAFYALYFVFDHAVYIRFFLPVLPLLAVLAASVLVAAIARLLPEFASAAVVIAVVVIAATGFYRSVGFGASTLKNTEHRYLDAANFVGGLPSGAVCLAMQHSGSLHYYTAQPILRWDWTESSEIDRAVAALRETGHTVYVVLDDWEEPEFRSRFAGTRTLSSLGQPLMRTPGEGIRTSVYLLAR